MILGIKNEKFLSDQIGKSINKEYSLLYFLKGIDNIYSFLRMQILEVSKCDKSAEMFIFADDRNELEEKTYNGTNVYLKYC